MNFNDQRKTKGIRNHMTFSPFYFLVTVKPSGLSHLRSFDGLTVNHYGRRFSIFSLVLSQIRVDCLLDEEPGFILFPFTEIIVNAGPLRKIMRKLSPLTPSVNQIKNGIENFSESINPWPAGRRRQWKIFLNNFKLSVSEICA